MKKDFLLVDGYNIIYAWDDLKELAEISLESARNKLIDIMSNYQGYKSRLTVIVVFDGYLVKGNIGKAYQHNNIFVVFTKEAETADHYIEKTVNRFPRECKIRVATSDGLEQLIILGHGAVRMSARELKVEIEYVNHHAREMYIQTRPPKNNLLMDNLDDETQKILERMRRGEN